MASLNTKQANKNLSKKGFSHNHTDHNIFEFWHEEVLVTKTRTSHGTKPIHDGLISAMSNQCKVSKQFFLDFVRCTKSKDDYVAELKRNGIIEEKEEPSEKNVTHIPAKSGTKINPTTKRLPPIKD